MLKVIQSIFIYNTIGIILMVLYKEAYVIVCYFIEVLLCTGKRIEVFYFHVFSDGRGKRWLFFQPRHSQA